MFQTKIIFHKILHMKSSIQFFRNYPRILRKRKLKITFFAIHSHSPHGGRTWTFRNISGVINFYNQIRCKSISDTLPHPCAYPFPEFSPESSPTLRLHNFQHRVFHSYFLKFSLNNFSNLYKREKEHQDIG